MHDAVFNGRFVAQPLTGVQRFAHEVLRAMSGGSRPIRPRLALPADASERDLPLGSAMHSRGRFRGHLWEQAELPVQRRGEFLVNLCNCGPVSVRDQLVVLHDVAFLANPGNFGWRFRAWYSLMVRSYLARGARLATVSNFSAGEIARLLGYARHRITVLHGGVEHIRRVPADHSVLKRLQLERKQFVLSFGSGIPNKNFVGVARAAQLLGARGMPFLVVGAPPSSRVFGQVSLDWSRLKHAGRVSDAELRALYEAAACFVFPSHYEGFGLPPLEAMSCGCPVVASRTTSLPEICGTAAVYCDPDDPADIAAGIRRIVESRSLQDELGTAGRLRAEQFSWSAAADRLSELIPA